MKIKHYEESYIKINMLLEFLQKDKKYWATKLGKVDTKAKELNALRESPKLSLEDALCSIKELRVRSHRSKMTWW